MYLRTDYELKVLEEPLKAARAKPYTLEHLAEWLGTRPKDETYIFWDFGDCLLCRYGRSLGLEAKSGLFSNVVVQFRANGVGASHLDPIISHVNTMGAALTRAQAAIERLS